jgi:hypothetical protein
VKLLLASLITSIKMRIITVTYEADQAGSKASFWLVFGMYQSPISAETRSILAEDSGGVRQALQANAGRVSSVGS